MDIVEALMKALTLLVATAAAAWAKKAKSEAAECNDAVNHRHTKGTPRLYDLALRNDERTDELLEWKRGYEKVGMLDTGDKVDDFMQRFSRLEDLCSPCDECPKKETPEGPEDPEDPKDPFYDHDKDPKDPKDPNGFHPNFEGGQG